MRTICAIFAAAVAFAAHFGGEARPLFVGITDICKERYNSVEEYYARALERCGHVPFVIPKTDDEAALARILDHADAIVVSGGGDIDPAIYGEARHPRAGVPDPFRDKFDFAILHYAAKRRIPVLGVCRGEQAMNVCFGGSLHQHVPDVFDGKNGKPAVRHGRYYSYFGAATNPPTHTVSIVPGTKLARLVGTNELAVASHHHQAVNRVAPGFRVCAYSPDGAVEAIESETLPMIGVQFHPETVVAERPPKGFDLPRLEQLFRRLGEFGESACGTAGQSSGATSSP